MESWVKLYDQNTGALVTFSLPVSEDEIAAVAESLRALAAAGFSATLPGTEPGQRVETITAAVLGETSRDEPCVYLYGDPRLKFRLVTVWQEQIPLLPEDLRAKLRKVKVWPGAAPDRETAERKRVLVPANFRAVLENTGTEDAPKWRFVRALSQPGNDAGRKAAAPSESAAANTPGRPYLPEVLKERLAAVAKNAAKSLPNWDYSKKRKIIAAHVSKTLGGDTQRYELFQWLIGEASTKNTPPETIYAIWRWLDIQERDGVWSPSPEAVAEMRAAHRAALVASGQASLLEPQHEPQKSTDDIIAELGY